ncbi:hypothetical protein JCM8097_000862 [Rhodosporidiobolus ruineniae]
MPALLAARTLRKRDLAEDAGSKIQNWLASLDPSAVFAIAICVCFFLLLVLISVIWEIVLKCRERTRSHEQAQWYRLPDGSSVRVDERGDGPAYLGPMATLMRHGPQGRGYAPTETGSTAEMRGEANGLTRYGAYDPPVEPQRYQLADPGAAPPRQNWQQQGYPPQGPPPPTPRRSSTATAESGWSGDTRIATAGAEKPAHQFPGTPGGYVKSANPLSFPATSSPTSLQSVPSISSAPRAASFSAPVQAGTPSVVQSLASGRTSLPLPNSPRTTSTSSGEAAFSTPKPAATPVASAATRSTPAHVRAGSVPLASLVPGTPPRASHARTNSGSGFTPRPLGLSTSSTPAVPTVTAPSRPSLLASSITLTSVEAPKVDLKRTWSIGTWIPTFSAAAGDKDEDGEAKVGLVSRDSLSK